MADLKKCYKAVSKEIAEGNLDELEAKWGENYPIVIKSWRDNRERLSEFFQYTEPIRRIIYTTNTVEDYHRQIRKVTKNKGVFPNDTSLEKLVYLVYRNISKKMDPADKGLGQDIIADGNKIWRGSSYGNFVLNGGLPSPLAAQASLGEES